MLLDEEWRSNVVKYGGVEPTRRVGFGEWGREVVRVAIKIQNSAFMLFCKGLEVRALLS